MNNSRQLLNFAKAFYKQVNRNASSTPISGPRVEKLKQMQKKMQIDDGELVHLKNGFGDRALYSLTVFLTVVGLGLSAETLVKLTLGNK